MATSIPYVTVSVNRCGFKVLDTRINLVNTEEPRAITSMLVLAVCGFMVDDLEYKDQMEWIESQYNKEVEAQSTCSDLSTYVLKPFYVNDDLVSIRYEVVYDNY